MLVLFPLCGKLAGTQESCVTGQGSLVHQILVQPEHPAGPAVISHLGSFSALLSGQALCRGPAPRFLFAFLLHPSRSRSTSLLLPSFLHVSDRPALSSIPFLLSWSAIAGVFPDLASNPKPPRGHPGQLVERTMVAGGGFWHSVCAQGDVEMRMDQGSCPWWKGAGALQVPKGGLCFGRSRLPIHLGWVDETWQGHPAASLYLVSHLSTGDSWWHLPPGLSRFPLSLCWRKTKKI